MSTTVYHEIIGFELFEDVMGSGVSCVSKGILADEGQAKMWASKSAGYRRYAPINKVITVFGSLAELEQKEKEVKIAALLKKLTPEETELLKGYFRTY